MHAIIFNTLNTYRNVTVLVKAVSERGYFSHDGGTTCQKYYSACT
jgi:hypothetical protein